jgi:hypothetical protein
MATANAQEPHFYVDESAQDMNQSGVVFTYAGVQTGSPQQTCSAVAEAQIVREKKLSEAFVFLYGVPYFLQDFVPIEERHALGGHLGRFDRNAYSTAPNFTSPDFQTYLSYMERLSAYVDSPVTNPFWLGPEIIVNSWVTPDSLDPRLPCLHTDHSPLVSCDVMWVKQGSRILMKEYYIEQLNAWYAKLVYTSHEHAVSIVDVDNQRTDLPGGRPLKPDPPPAPKLRGDSGDNEEEVDMRKLYAFAVTAYRNELAAYESADAQYRLSPLFE